MATAPSSLPLGWRRQDVIPAPVRSQHPHGIWGLHSASLPELNERIRKMGSVQRDPAHQDLCGPRAVFKEVGEAAGAPSRYFKKSSVVSWRTPGLGNNNC